MGALGTFLLKAYVVAVDQWFDIRNGTDTNGVLRLDGLTVKSLNKDRGASYQPTRVTPLRSLFREIGSLIPRDGVLVDFGCGKGRVLLIGSDFGLRKAIGIEFAHELCTIARRNCDAYRQARETQTEFEIVEADVVDYDVPPEANIFFLYNPFDEFVLKRVLDNIVRSLQIRPRKAYFIYYNPHLDHVFSRRFAKVREFHFRHYLFTLYSNQEQGTGPPEEAMSGGSPFHHSS